MKITLFVTIFLILVLSSGLLATDTTIYGTTAVGNINTQSPVFAIGQAENYYYNKGDSATAKGSSRALLPGLDDYVIVRGFVTPNDPEQQYWPYSMLGPISSVKLYVSYTYDGPNVSGSSFEVSTRITTLTDSVAVFTITGSNPVISSIPAGDYPSDIELDNNSTPVLEYDLTGDRNPWTFDDVNKLQVVFQNKAAGWAAVDAMWLVLEFPLEIEDLQDRTTPVLGIDSIDNPQYLIKVISHNGTIKIVNLNFTVLQNTEFQNKWGTTHLRVWDDKDGNGMVNGDDEEFDSVSPYEFQDSVVNQSLDLTFNIDFNVSGTKYLLITADTLSGVQKDKTELKLNLPTNCFDLEVGETYVDHSINENLPEPTEPQLLREILTPIICSFEASNPASLTDLTIMSGDLFKLTANIKIGKALGTNIRWRSALPWAEVDYYDPLESGAIASFDSIVVGPISLGINGNGDVSANFLAKKKGSLHFGAYAIGFDALTSTDIKGGYRETDEDTLASAYLVERVKIVPGLTICGTDVSGEPVKQGQTKVPFLRVRFNAIDQYDSITADTIRFDKTAATVAGDVGTVYLYTDSYGGTPNNSIANETKLDSDVFTSGNVTFQLGNLDTIPNGVNGFKDVLFCADINSNASTGKMGFQVTDSSSVVIVPPARVKSFTTLASSDRNILQTAQIQVTACESTTPNIVQIKAKLVVDSISVLPTDVEPGESFTVRMDYHVTETPPPLPATEWDNPDSATEINPNSNNGVGKIDFVCANGATLLEDPTAASVAEVDEIDPEDVPNSDYFSWTYDAESAGDIEFSGWVTGVDANDEVEPLDSYPIKSNTATCDTLLTIKNRLNISASDIGRDQILPGAEDVVILKFDLSSKGVLEVTSLKYTVNALGPVVPDYTNIDFIKVYIDEDENGLVDTEVDTLLDWTSVSGATVIMDLSENPITVSNNIATPVKLLTTVTMASGAALNSSFTITSAAITEPGDANSSFVITSGTYNAIIDFAGITSPTCTTKKIGSFTVNSITFGDTSVNSGNLKLSGWGAGVTVAKNSKIYTEPLISAKEIVNNNYVDIIGSAADANFDDVYQGNTGIAMIKFATKLFDTNAKEFKITSIKVRHNPAVTPALDDNDLSALKLYIDIAPLGRNDGEDIPIGDPQTMSGGFCTFPINSAHPTNGLVTKDLKNYLITMDVDSDFGTDMNNVQLQIFDASYVNVEQPNSISTTDDPIIGNSVVYPISSNPRKIFEAATLQVLGFSTVPVTEVEVGDDITVNFRLRNSFLWTIISNDFNQLVNVKIVDAADSTNVLDTNYNGTGGEVELAAGGAPAAEWPPVDLDETLHERGDSLYEEHTFTWTYTALAPGQVIFTGKGICDSNEIVVKESNGGTPLNIIKTLNCEITDISPDPVNHDDPVVQGQVDIPMLRVIFSHDYADFVVTAIAVFNNSDGLSDEDIKEVKLYHDAGTLGVIDDADTLIIQSPDPAVFSSGSVDLSTGVFSSVDVGVARNFIIAVDLKDDAETDPDGLDLDPSHPLYGHQFKPSLSIGIADFDMITFGADTYVKIDGTNDGYNTALHDIEVRGLLKIIDEDGVGSPNLTVTHEGVGGDLESGMWILIKMKVKNIGEVDIDNVAFDCSENNSQLLVGDAGSATFVDFTPDPGGTLASDASIVFNINYIAADTGLLDFSGFAKGDDTALGIAAQNSATETSAPQIEVKESADPVLTTSFEFEKGLNYSYDQVQQVFNMKISATNGGNEEAVALNVAVYDNDDPLGEIWKVDIGDVNIAIIETKPADKKDKIFGQDSYDFDYTFKIIGVGTTVFRACTDADDDGPNTVTSGLTPVTINVYNHAEPLVTGFVIESVSDNSQTGVLQEEQDIRVTLTIKNTGEVQLKYAAVPALSKVGVFSLKTESPAPWNSGAADIDPGDSHDFTYLFTANGDIDETVQFQVDVDYNIENNVGTDLYSGDGHKITADENAISNTVQVISTLALPAMEGNNPITVMASKVNTYVTAFVSQNYMPLKDGYLHVLDPVDNTDLVAAYNYSETYNIVSTVALTRFASTDHRYMFILKGNGGSTEYTLKGNRNIDNTTFSESFTKYLGSFTYFGTFTVLNFGSQGSNSIFFAGADNSMLYRFLPTKGDDQFLPDDSIFFDGNNKVGNPIGATGGTLGTCLIFYVNDFDHTQHYLVSADPGETASILASGSDTGRRSGSVVGDMVFDFVNGKYFVADSNGKMARFDDSTAYDNLEIDIRGDSGHLCVFSYGPKLDTSANVFFIIDDEGYLYRVNRDLSGFSSRKIMDFKPSYSPYIFDGYLVVCDVAGTVHTIRTDSSMEPYRKPYPLGPTTNSGPSYSSWQHTVLIGNDANKLHQISEP